MLQPYTVGPRPERIDRIAAKLYGPGRERDTVTLLLDANPGLALQAPFIAPRTVIQVPSPPAAKTASVQLPWE